MKETFCFNFHPCHCLQQSPKNTCNFGTLFSGIPGNFEDYYLIQAICRALGVSTLLEFMEKTLKMKKAFCFDY